MIVASLMLRCCSPSYLQDLEMTRTGRVTYVAQFKDEYHPLERLIFTMVNMPLIYAIYATPKTVLV